MRVGKVAVVAIALLVAAGCGSTPKATNPADQDACAGLKAAYTTLQKPISNALTGKASAADNSAIMEGASSLRMLADGATEPLKSALIKAATAADHVADGNVTLSDADEVSKTYKTLGEEVGKQCGSAAG